MSTISPKAKAAPKPASAETAAIPEAGIKAKGISERAMIENPRGREAVGGEA